MQGFPQEIQEFAEASVVLQGVRHPADYVYEVTHEKQDTVAAIDRAEDAINQFETAHRERRLGFIAHVLLKRRSPSEIRHG